MDHRELAALGARALNAKLTPKQRSASARKAVKERWRLYRLKKKLENKSGAPVA